MSVFFIENPLLDIQVQVPDKSLFEKYALPVGGACLCDDKQQALYPELLAMPGVEFIPGGSALNSARATNFVLSNQGQEGQVAYFGSIGKDNYGEILEKALSDVKINANFYKESGVATGTCGVVVHEKERSLCANLSAACKYSTEHLTTNMDKLNNAKLIYTTAFFITSNFEALIQVGKHAAEKDIPMGYNLSAVFLMMFNKNEVLEGLEYADYVWANEDEADKWAEINALEDKSRQGVAKSLVTFKKANAKRGRVAIVTQGADPVIVARQVGDEVVLEEFPIEPIAAEQLVDTNGAGDSFVGGFLSQLAQGKDLATCVKAGIYLSREVVQQSGCKMPAQMTFA